MFYTEYCSTLNWYENSTKIINHSFSCSPCRISKCHTYTTVYIYKNGTSQVFCAKSIFLHLTLDHMSEDNAQQLIRVINHKENNVCGKSILTFSGFRKNSKSCLEKQRADAPSTPGVDKAQIVASSPFDFIC